MTDSLRRKVVRRLPGVGWRTDLLEQRALQVDRLRGQLTDRDAKIAELRETVRKERAARQKAQEQLVADRPEFGETAPPSFRRNLINLRRDVEALRPLDRQVFHPVLQIPRKLRNYRLAASHGVAVPEVLGVWGALDLIDLSGMPERFVLKSDGGAGGHGVFPLRRIDDEDRFALIGGDEIHTRESLIERFRAKNSLLGPWFAEDFLEQREVGEEIPDDIKVYASYGEVTMALLRRMPVHANLGSARYRYVDGHGVDLGTDISPGQTIDETIPLPQPFEEFVTVARHLSRAVALPFIRVDIYDTVDGPVLGELTRAPGGAQRFRKDHDIAMGRAWDEARWRVDMDVIKGRPLRNLHGLRPAPSYYPEDHRSHSDDDPRGWEVVRADCSQWCFGGTLPPARD